MPGPPRTVPAWLLVSLIGLLVGGTFVQATAAGRREQSALGFLAPLVEGLARIGRAASKRPEAMYSTFAIAAACTAALTALSGFVIRGKTAVRSALILAAAGIASFGQAAYVSQKAAAGNVLYLLAAVTVITARLLPDRLGEWHGGPPPGRRGRFTIGEAGELLLLCLVAIVYRFYALNILFPDFDGELANQMAASTSLQGSLDYSFVTRQAPCGLLYHLAHFVVFRLFGTSLLAARAVIAFSSWLAVPLLYGFLRRSGGRAAALLGASFLALEPVSLSWARVDVAAHVLAVPFGIAIAWVTWEALETPSWWRFTLVALFMAASYHLYPSAQVLVGVPLAVLGSELLLRRDYFRSAIRKIPLLLAGFLLWLLALPLGIFLVSRTFQWMNPLALNASKTAWSHYSGRGLLGMVGYLTSSAWGRLGEFASRVFLRTNSNVYTTLRSFPMVPPRYETAIVCVLLALGIVLALLALRGRLPRLLLAWTFIASLPGFLSTDAEARRLSAIFPALIALAAVAGVALFRASSSLLGTKAPAAFVFGFALVAQAVLMAHLVFDQPMGSPGSARIASEIARRAAPGTLVVLDFSRAYYIPNEVTLQLLDVLHDSRGAISYRMAEAADWPRQLFSPTPGLEDYYYRSTFLRDQIQKLRHDDRHDRVLYVIQDDPARQQLLAALRDLYPGAKTTEFRPFESHRALDLRFLEVPGGLVERARWPRLAVAPGARSTPAEDGWLAGVRVRRSEATPPTSGAEIEAALLVPELGRKALHAPAGVAARLDGEAWDEKRIVPLTVGAHSLRLRIEDTALLPLTLRWSESAVAGHPIPVEAFAGPEIASVTGVAADRPLPFEGFGVPARHAAIDVPHLDAWAVATDGTLAIVHAFDTSWTVRVLAPDGSERARFTTTVHGSLPGIAFTPGGELLIVEGMTLRWHRITGELRRELDLAGVARSVRLHATNARGEIFLLDTLSHSLLRLDARGELLQTLSPPGAREAAWKPWELSVSPNGAVAVLGFGGVVDVFARQADGRFGWLRSVSAGLHQGALYNLVLDEGWTVSRYLDSEEVRVLDDHGRRRLPRDSSRDLSRSLPWLCPRLATDGRGTLYAYHEGGAAIYKAAGVQAEAARGAAPSGSTVTEAPGRPSR